MTIRLSTMSLTNIIDLQQSLELGRWKFDPSKGSLGRCRECRQECNVYIFLLPEGTGQLYYLYLDCVKSTWRGNMRLEDWAG
jgi:hypothetical protein